jgi:TetR/AcrR family transcriptional regulator
LAPDVAARREPPSTATEARNGRSLEAAPIDSFYTDRYTRAMDNRSTILARALELWSERGYDAVGVQEIVDSSGITKPTLYHYFGSKRGLLDALIEERSSGLLEAVAVAADYRGDLPLTLETVARSYFDFALKNAPFYRLQLALWFAPHQSDGYGAILVRNLGQHEILERLFTAAANDHGNMRGRHKAYAATFLGMVNTYIGLHLNGYAVLDAQLVHHAVHQYMHGIYS